MRLRSASGAEPHPASEPSARTEAWLLAGLVLLAAAVRFPSLHAASFWVDESYSVTALRHDLGGTWDAVRSTESTPPLYYLLAWGWTRAFGVSEFGLRSLSAVFGVALVPAVWLAGRELLSRRAALVGAALVATSPLLVWFSQESRAYMLMVLLCTVALWAAVRADRRVPGALGWWALLSVLALATQYVSVFPVVLEAAVLLWRRRDRAAVLAVAAVGVVGAALLPLLVAQRDNPLAATVPGSIGRRLVQIPKQLVVGFDAPWETATAIAALLLVAAGLVALGRRADRPARHGALVLGAVAGASVAGPLVLLVFGQDQILTRYMLPALPLLLLVVGTGFAAARGGTVLAGLLCAVGLVVVVAVAVTPTLRTRDDWRGAADALRGGLRPRALVVSPADGTLPLGLYVPGLALLTQPVAAVREIDLVDVGLRRDRRPSPAVPPPGAPLAVLPGFRFAGVRDTGTYVVRRYVAPVPTLASSAALGSIAPDRRGGVALLQK